MREEEKQTSQSSKWKQITKKKWVFPAIYIASAALLLTGVLWYQTSTDNLAGNEKDNIQNVADNQYSDYTNEEAVPVNVAEENFKMPVLDEKEVMIKKQFYDNAGTSENQEAALVFYNNTYYPNTGIDIAMENGESFDVVSSLSGTVVRAENDPILGNVVEIKHENGVATYYQSLGEMHVETGAAVDQGDVIGTAGTSVYNKDAGVHVHFEIRQNNEPVNPVELFNKPLSSLENKADKNQNAASADESAKQEDSTQSDDSANQDESSKTDDANNSTDNTTNTTESVESDKSAEQSKEQPSTENKDQTDVKEQENSNKKTEEDASIGMTRA